MKRYYYLSSLVLFCTFLLGNKVFAQEASDKFSVNDRIYIYEYILHNALFDQSNDVYSPFFYFGYDTPIDSSVSKENLYIAVNTYPYMYKKENWFEAFQELVGIDTLVEYANAVDEEIVHKLHSQINIRPQQLTLEQGQKLIKTDKDCLSVFWLSNIYNNGKKYYVFLTKIEMYETCEDCIINDIIFEFEVCAYYDIINFRKRYGRIVRYKGILFSDKNKDLSIFECK